MSARMRFIYVVTGYSNVDFFNFCVQLSAAFFRREGQAFFGRSGFASFTSNLKFFKGTELTAIRFVSHFLPN
jgi:hypothetical protein